MHRRCAGRAVLCGAPRGGEGPEQPRGSQRRSGGYRALAREARLREKALPAAALIFPLPATRRALLRTEGATCIHTASRLSKPSSRVTPRSILRCERQAPPSRPTRMSDKPGVPQPSKSKPTPAVPQPIAQPRAPNLDGGRGAPAPNGVGRGGARDGRGDTFAGRVRAVVSAPGPGFRLT